MFFFRQTGAQSNLAPPIASLQTAADGSLQ
jgi:hypothetical protein